MEEQTIIDIWETFKDYISEKSRETAASQYVEFLLGQDVELETFEGLLGYDPHLDTAIELVLEEHKDAEEGDDYEEDTDEEDY